MTHIEPTRLDHALALAAAGFRVFPLKAQEKVPAISDWTKTATTDVDQIWKWFDGRFSNIGILTTGLLVIDVDVKNGKNGDATLADLALFGDEIPVTREHRTPTGGRHLFLRAPGPVANGVDVLGTGLDIRGQNGYVVAPGSVVGDGVYTVEADAAIADAPDWVVAKCKRPRGRPPASGRVPPAGVDQEAAERRAIALLDAEPGYVKGQGCDAKTLQLAMRVKDLGVGEDRCWELMLDHWNERTDPPWPAEKLRLKVANAYRYGQEPVGARAPEIEFTKLSDAEAAVPAEVEAAHPVLALNDEFAFLLNTRGHQILWETTDVEGRPALRFLPEQTFHAMLSAQRLDTGEKKYFISKLWMQSPQRRSYRGTCFRPQQPAVPGYYNLWRGFAYAPFEGDVNTAPDRWRRAVNDWQTHAFNNICQTNTDQYDWLMQWFGHLVQRPWEKPQVAMVLRGPKGTGKNALFDRVAALFGGHAMVAADRRYLLSHFNAHMEQTLLLVLDEAFWAGDKAGEGVLKGLITGAEHQIEKKGQDSYKARNLVRVGMIGNEDWLVPATEDERRFGVLDVGTGKQRANAWFREMREAMEAGGYSLLLRTLLDVDLTGFDLAAAPATSGLLAQKMASLDTTEQWWNECLYAGEIVHCGYDGWPSTIETRSAYQSLQMYRRDTHTTIRLPDLRRFTTTMKGMGYEVRQMMVDGVRSMRLILPPLAECRRRFDAKLGGNIDWPEC